MSINVSMDLSYLNIMIVLISIIQGRCLQTEILLQFDNKLEMLFTGIILLHFAFWMVCSLRHGQKDEGNLPIERYLKRYILINKLCKPN